METEEEGGKAPLPLPPPLPEKLLLPLLPEPEPDRPLPALTPAPMPLPLLLPTESSAEFSADGPLLFDALPGEARRLWAGKLKDIERGKGGKGGGDSVSCSSSPGCVWSRTCSAHSLVDELVFCHLVSRSAVSSAKGTCTTSDSEELVSPSLAAPLCGR